MWRKGSVFAFERNGFWIWFLLWGRWVILFLFSSLWKLGKLTVLPLHAMPWKAENKVLRFPLLSRYYERDKAWSYKYEFIYILKYNYFIRLNRVNQVKYSHILDNITLVGDKITNSVWAVIVDVYGNTVVGECELVTTELLYVNYINVNDL